MNKIITSIVDKKVNDKIAAVAKAAEEEITVSRKMFALEIAVALLGGIVIGMFLSPRRNSSYTIASNNKINGGEDEDGEYEYDEDDFDEPDDTNGGKSKFIKL